MSETQRVPDMTSLEELTATIAEIEVLAARLRTRREQDAWRNQRSEQNMADSATLASVTSLDERRGDR